MPGLFQDMARDQLLTFDLALDCLDACRPMLEFVPRHVARHGCGFRLRGSRLAGRTRRSINRKDGVSAFTSSSGATREAPVGGSTIGFQLDFCNDDAWYMSIIYMRDNCRGAPMKRFLIAVSFLQLCVTMPAMPAAAQDCSRALIVSTYREHDELSRDYRMARFVTRQEYEELKKNVSADGVIYGVPVGANYDEYRARALKISESVSVSLSEHQVRNILWTGLDPNSLKAYESCLIANNYGLFLYVRSATKNEIEIVLKYRPTSGSGEIAITWTGGTPDIRELLPKRIGIAEITRIVPRPAKDNLLLGVNVVGDGPNAPPAVMITAWPGDPPPLPSAPCEKVNAKGECTLCSGILSEQAIRSGQRKTFTCNNIVPNQNYRITAYGEFVGYGVLELFGVPVVDSQGRESLSSFEPRTNPNTRNGVPGSSTSAAAFRFESPSVLMRRNIAEGALQVEHCDRGGAACTIAGDARWKICLIGVSC
jgi:hypothetical protein